MKTSNDDEYDDLIQYQESLHDLSALKNDIDRLRDNTLPGIYEDPFDELIPNEDDTEHIVNQFIEKHKDEFREDTD